MSFLALAWLIASTEAAMLLELVGLEPEPVLRRVRETLRTPATEDV